MISSVQREIVGGLVRKMAGMLRGDALNPLRLMNSLIDAGEALVPERYLLPFSAVLDRIIEEKHLDRTSLPPAVGSLINKNRRCAIENLQKLDRFATRIQQQFRASPQDAVLAGEGAAPAALYGDIGAFPVSEFSALLRDGTYTDGDRPKQMAPAPEDCSIAATIGKTVWRSPKPALLIALLARHIGDPAAAPVPPVWPHLGTALLLWKDRIGAGEILELGDIIGRREQVERGLAVMGHIFPELENYVGTNKLSMPRWERKYAVPIAARRITAEGRD